MEPDPVAEDLDVVEYAAPRLVVRPPDAPVDQLRLERGEELPWLAREWHPTRNELRPDQVSRASAREVIWRFELGHEWSAVIYARTLSPSGCPTCYRGDVSERVRAGKRRALVIRDEKAAARVDALLIERS